MRRRHGCCRRDISGHPPECGLANSPPAYQRFVHQVVAAPIRSALYASRVSEALPSRARSDPRMQQAQPPDRQPLTLSPIRCEACFPMSPQRSDSRAGDHLDVRLACTFARKYPFLCRKSRSAFGGARPDCAQVRMDLRRPYRQLAAAAYRKSVSQRPETPAHPNTVLAPGQS